MNSGQWINAGNVMRNVSQDVTTCHWSVIMMPGVKMEKWSHALLLLTTLRLSINSVQGFPVNEAIFKHYIYSCVFLPMCLGLMTLNDSQESTLEMNETGASELFTEGLMVTSLGMWDCEPILCNVTITSRPGPSLVSCEPSLTSDWQMLRLYKCWWEQI